MITSLLFDLGGVIVPLDRQRCVQAYTQAGMADADQMLGLYKQTGAFLQLEEGLITPRQFRDELRKHFSRPVSDDTIDRCFHAFLLPIPTERLRALERLHRHYRIYILSNTNAIVFDQLIPGFFQADGHDLHYYCDGTVLSHQAHLCKPDPRIFRLCQTKLGLRPQETLFIDDSQANCQAAEALGFHTLHLAPGQEFYHSLTIPD